MSEKIDTKRSHRDLSTNVQLSGQMTIEVNAPKRILFDERSGSMGICVLQGLDYQFMFTEPIVRVQKANDPVGQPRARLDAKAVNTQGEGVVVAGSIDLAVKFVVRK